MLFRSRREASLNAPVGLDGYTYGYRDKTGDKLTLSRPRPYGKSFGSGDTIGMYISLPPRRQPTKKDPNDPAHLKRERIPIDLKGQEVFEILEYPQSKEMAALMDYGGKTTSSASVPSSTKKTTNGKIPERSGPTPPGKPATVNLRPLPTLPNSRIAFFVNGESQGIAFQDLYDYLPLRQSDTQRKAKEKKRTREGVKEHRENPFDDGTLGYYPFISLFNDAIVRLNPGPEFEYPPPPNINSFLDKQANPPMEEEEEPSECQSSIQEQEGKKQWRPACERYPEFMQEEWAMDALEEEQAKDDAMKQATADKVQDDKRKQKEKRKAQADARKKQRKAAATVGTTAELTIANTALEDDRFGPGAVAGYGGVFNQPSPSPLRHATVYDPREGSVELGHSPAPTFASYGEFQGNQSGNNSETHDMDLEQELEAFVDGGPDTPA